MEILSVNNPRVKQWKKYEKKKYRDQDQRFLVEEAHLIEEALQANVLETLLVLQGKEVSCNQGVECIEVSQQVLDKLSTHVSSVSMIGICKQLTHKAQSLERIVYLDNIQDPGNVGTIIRTAYALGYDAIYMSDTSVDLYNEKVIRATQGALFHMPIIRGNLLEMMSIHQEHGVHVYATALDKQAKMLSSIAVSTPFALVFGNEGSGVCPEILAQANTKVMIEMKQFESLNVAVAAGICMYEFSH